MLPERGNFEEKSAFELAEDEQVQGQKNGSFHGRELYRGFWKRQVISASMYFRGGRADADASHVSREEFFLIGLKSRNNTGNRKRSAKSAARTVVSVRKANWAISLISEK